MTGGGWEEFILLDLLWQVLSSRSGRWVHVTSWSRDSMASEGFYDGVDGYLGVDAHIICAAIALRSAICLLTLLIWSAKTA